MNLSEIKKSGLHCLLITISPGLIAMPMEAWAQPVTPKPPALEKFSECRYSDDPGIFESIQMCNLPVGQAAKQLGNPVDGDANKRHFSWHLAKMTVKDPSGNPTGYKVTQIAYDCITRQAQQRIVDEFINIPGIGIRPFSDVSKDYMKWLPVTGLDLGFLRGRCPTKQGFTRIGDMQFAFGQIMRRGNIVNIRSIGRDDRPLVFSVDCSSLTYGVNAKPSKPVMPGSVGAEVYERICQ
jgi:hypothetical protein